MPPGTRRRSCSTATSTEGRPGPLTAAMPPAGPAPPQRLDTARPARRHSASQLNDAARRPSRRHQRLGSGPSSRAPRPGRRRARRRRPAGTSSGPVAEHLGQRPGSSSPRPGSRPPSPRAAGSRTPRRGRDTRAPLASSTSSCDRGGIHPPGPHDPRRCGDRATASASGRLSPAGRPGQDERDIGAVGGQHVEGAATRPGRSFRGSAVATLSDVAVAPGGRSGRAVPGGAGPRAAVSPSGPPAPGRDRPRRPRPPRRRRRPTACARRRRRDAAPGGCRPGNAGSAASQSSGIVQHAVRSCTVTTRPAATGRRDHEVGAVDDVAGPDEPLDRREVEPGATTTCRGRAGIARCCRAPPRPGASGPSQAAPTPAHRERATRRHVVRGGRARRERPDAELADPRPVPDERRRVERHRAAAGAVGHARRALHTAVSGRPGPARGDR